MEGEIPFTLALFFLFFHLFLVCRCDDRNTGVCDVFDQNVSDFYAARRHCFVDVAHHLKNRFLRYGVCRFAGDDLTVLTSHRRGNGAHGVGAFRLGVGLSSRTEVSRNRLYLVIFAKLDRKGTASRANDTGKYSGAHFRTPISLRGRSKCFPIRYFGSYPP